MDNISTYLKYLSDVYCNLISYTHGKVLDLQTSIVASYTAAIADEKSAIWATLITDIITIAAALGALALPISLNVIETTRTRYQSPSLLKIATILSKSDAKNLNRYVFLALGGALMAKLTLSARLIDPITLVPYLAILSFYFFIVIRNIYNHLRFTYTLSSNIETIHNETYNLIDKYTKLTFLAEPIKPKQPSRFNLKRWQASKLPMEDIICAFLEIETYSICSNPNKADIDERFTKISYKAVDRLDDSDAVFFINTLLNAMPTVLARVEISREVDVYQHVSGLYLYLTMKAILSKPSFVSHIPTIERIARFREGKLPEYGRFCRNGRIFLNFANRFNKESSAYPHLLRHFKLLIDSAVREQPENLPEILSNIRYVIQFKDNHQKGIWDLPGAIPELWGFPALTELNEQFESAYRDALSIEELKTNFDTNHQEKLINHIKEKSGSSSSLEEKIQTFEKTIQNIWSGLALNRFADDIEIETLRSLSLLLPKSPETFINCRALRNPAGSRSFNVGHSPVPSSIQECINAFINPANFDNRHLFRDDLQDYKIVDTIGALIIYELWDIYIIRAAGAGISPPIASPQLPKRTLGELKSATQKTALLKNSLLKALDNRDYTSRLRLLSDQTATLRELALDLLSKLEDALSAEIKRLLTTQPLEKHDLEIFINEYINQLRNSIKNYPLFKHTKVSRIDPILININLPREAFLAGRDTHYIFDNHGSRVADELNRWLCSNILSENPNSLSSSTALPTQNTAWIICSGSAIKDFERNGFEASARYLTWPDKKYKAEYIKVESETNNFYPVQIGECLLMVSYEASTSDLPVKITWEDNKENVTFKIEHFVNV